MWQMVGFIPTTFSERSSASEDITLLSAKLSTSFFLESFIHAKEKLNIVQWVELLTKQFDSSASACRSEYKDIFSHFYFDVIRVFVHFQFTFCRSAGLFSFDMIFHKFQRSTVFYRGRGKSRFKIKEAFMSDKKRTLFFQKKKLLSRV
jgi:hypothetical protein